MEKLKELRLNDNKIITIKNSFLGNNFLEILDLGKNQIINFDYQTYNLNKIKSLSLLSNPIVDN